MSKWSDYKQPEDEEKKQYTELEQRIKMLEQILDLTERQVKAFIEIERRNFFATQSNLSYEETLSNWEKHRDVNLKIPIK